MTHRRSLPSPTLQGRSLHRRTSTALLVLAALSACAAEPSTTPVAELEFEVPERFASASDPTSAPSGALVGPWWREFGDERLAQLVDRALADNRDLRAALARLEATAAARTIAGAPFWPELDAGLSAQRQRRVFIGFPFGGGGVPSTTFTTYGLTLSAQWELDVWGRIRAGESASIADQQVALADFTGAQASLCAQVCKAWFLAIEARQQVDLANATVAAFRATADDVRARFRRGVRPALDVHLAATNLANAEAALAQRQDQLQRARRQLDVLVGRYPTGDLDAGDTLPVRMPQVPVGLPSELLQRRPDLIAAERKVAAAGCRVDAARAALYPRLSLTASAGTSSLELEDLVDDDFRVWSLGANLLEPLFRAGALKAEVDRQRALREAALADYGGKVLRAFAEVEDVLTTGSRIDERAAQLTAAARHAADARDLARTRYQGGLTDFLTVADTQRQAFTAESARLAVERARLENRIDLHLALGGGFGQAATGETP